MSASDSSQEDAPSDEQGRSAAELERDIDRIRSRLDSTISELEHRLSPNHIIDNFFDRLKGGTGTFAGNFGQQVLRHPVPSALFAAGIGWLLFADRGNKARRQNSLRAAGAATPERSEPPSPVPFRRDSGPRPYAIREQPPAPPQPSAHQRSFGLFGGISHSRNSGGDRKMSGYRDTSQDWASNVEHGRSAEGHFGSHRFQGVGHVARDQVARARTGFEHMLEEQPLVLGAVAVALGAVLGATLPTTRVENRYLGPKRDQLQERATEFAREQWERAKQAALTAGSAAREEAERALSSDQSASQQTRTGSAGD